MEEMKEKAEKLFEGIKRHTELSPEDEEKIFSRLTRKVIKRKQFYLH